MLLNFKETKKILADYNIPLVETEVIESRKQALNFAEKKWPVVLKVFSEEVLHRTESGLVKTGIGNKKELSSSLREMERRSKNLKKKKILIQRTEKGTEIICGMKRDETFGPVLMFGLGGIFVEVLKDVSFSITPLNKKESLEMIKEIKGYKILKGFRGFPEANLEEISKLLLSLSKISEENGEIKEIDFNPAFVNEKTLKVVDFKIII